MKPTKGRKFCPGAGKDKILFETQKKADNYLAFNAKEIRVQSGYAPKRSYQCDLCGGWHVTSVGDESKPFLREEIFRQHLDNTTISQQGAPDPKLSDVSGLSEKNEKNITTAEYEEQVVGMDTTQARNFFSESMLSLGTQLRALEYRTGDSSIERKEIKRKMSKLHELIKKIDKREFEIRSGELEQGYGRKR